MSGPAHIGVDLARGLDRHVEVTFCHGQIVEVAEVRRAPMPALLQADIDLVAGEHAKLSAVNGLMATDYAAWSIKRRDAEDSATRRLVAAGAVIRFKGGDTSVRFRGIKATSTCGLPGALSNWKAAAEKLLRQAQDEREVAR